MKFAPGYFVLICALICALGVSIAHGQVIYNSASTAAESYQRGLSDVISAQGQKNLSDSQAAINATEARSNQIDNQLKSVNAYWEEKEIYSQHQQQVIAEADRKRSEYLERHGLQPLTPAEFDRTTGQINWPKILEQSQYDQYRKTLDDLFHTRSYVGALTGDQYVEATTALKDWRAALLAQKDQYPASILSQMLRFQLKLKRELDDNLG